MDLLLFLAQAQVEQAAPAAAAGMPEWMGYVLGPLGALCLLLVYAIYTEKYRIPGHVKIADELRVELKTANTNADTIRKQGTINKEEIRTKASVRERELEQKIEEWRDRHTKEKSVRAWYQAQAQAFADDAGEDLRPPSDIDKTHYGDN